MKALLGIVAYFAVGLLLHYFIRVYDEYQEHRERCKRNPIDVPWYIVVSLWGLTPLFVVVGLCIELLPLLRLREFFFSPKSVAAWLARRKKKDEVPPPQPDPESYRDLEDSE